MHTSIITTPGNGITITLEDAKAWLRVPASFNDDDTIITNLEAAARNYIEEHTNRLLSPTNTVEDHWYGLPSEKKLVLKYGPVTNVVSIHVWNDTTNQYIAVYESGAFTTNINVELETHPYIAPQQFNALPQRITIKNDGGYKIWRVIYEAGHGELSGLTPALLVHAMLLLMHDWYNERGNTGKSIPGIDSLLKKFKIGQHG